MSAALSPARGADVEANKKLYRHYIEDLWNKKDTTSFWHIDAASGAVHTNKIRSLCLSQRAIGFIRKSACGFADRFSARRLGDERSRQLSGNWARPNLTEPP
jgi:hypothetical protein